MRLCRSTCSTSLPRSARSSELVTSISTPDFNSSAPLIGRCPSSKVSKAMAPCGFSLIASGSGNHIQASVAGPSRSHSGAASRRSAISSSFSARNGKRVSENTSASPSRLTISGNGACSCSRVCTSQTQVKAGQASLRNKSSRFSDDDILAIDSLSATRESSWSNCFRDLVSTLSRLRDASWGNGRIPPEKACLPFVFKTRAAMRSHLTMFCVPMFS